MEEYLYRKITIRGYDIRLACGQKYLALRTIYKKNVEYKMMVLIIDSNTGLLAFDIPKLTYRDSIHISNEFNLTWANSVW